MSGDFEKRFLQEISRRNKARKKQKKRQQKALIKNTIILNFVVVLSVVAMPTLITFFNSYTLQSLPNNGTQKIFYDTTKPEKLFTFRIFLAPPKKQLDNPPKCYRETGNGDTENHYFLKVIDVNSDETMITTFIQLGQYVELKVPQGVYIIRYAIGHQWYGEQYLFGYKTNIFEYRQSLLGEPYKFEFNSEIPAWDLCMSSIKGKGARKKISQEEF